LSLDDIVDSNEETKEIELIKCPLVGREDRPYCTYCKGYGSWLLNKQTCRIYNIIVELESSGMRRQIK